jgi:hypothetical protein
MSADSGKALVKSFGLGALIVALMAAGCASQETNPTTPLPRPDAPPGRLLSYSGTIQPHAIDSHAFAVTTAGQVEVTLLGAELVSGSQPVAVGLGLGTASTGGSCLLTYTVNAQGGTRAQITGTGQEGALCISVFDPGTLTGPANYTVTVATP